jgi:glycosyltransferase involved in cell wall biosynthesis
MKAALITNYWKNSDGGGVKTYVVNLVDALKDKGVYVSVLFREGEDPENFCGGRNKFIFPIACYWQLKNIHPEVIYSQGTWYCLLSGVLYKKLHGCVLVHTFHTEPDKKLSFPAKIFFQSLLNSCDCVTFVSKKLQERVIEVDGLSFLNTAITYAGVHATEVSTEDVERFCKQYGIDNNAIILLTIGMTALSYKAAGLKLLILAVQILRKNYPNIVLIITREGKYSNEIRAFAHITEVENYVIFAGDVEKPLIALKLCDLYVHTPLGEGGVSAALLEAMAMKKPIVATDVGGIPEAITDGKNGLLVEPVAEKIAEKIDFLLRNDEYARQLGMHAKKTADEVFKWEIAAEKFLQCVK